MGIDEVLHDEGEGINEHNGRWVDMVTQDTRMAGRGHVGRGQDDLTQDSQRQRLDGVSVDGGGIQHCRANTTNDCRARKGRGKTSKTTRAYRGSGRISQLEKEIPLVQEETLHWAGLAAQAKADFLAKGRKETME